MRTVTFADSRVVDFLNEHYVVVWDDHNSEARGTGKQAAYTKAEMEAYPEGGGGTNLVTYFVSSEGKTLVQIEGYWSPERYLGEAQWALEVTLDNALDKLVERRRALTSESEKLATDHPKEMKKRVQDSAVRRTIAALGILAQWHETSKAVARVPIATTLESLREQTRTRVIA